MHFIGKPLMVEERRWVGHLIFVFEMAYCLTLLKWSWQITIILELLQYGSDFSAQDSLHSQANDFFFFRIHCLGYPTMYISLMMQWCLKTLISLARLYYSSVKFLILFIVTFLGTITNICGNVLRGLLKSATACVFFVCSLGVFSYSCSYSSRTALNSSPQGVGLVAHVKVFRGLPEV